METKANYVAVGGFVLFCVAALFAALLWLAGSQYTEEYAYYRTLFTGAVTGLGKGTPVRYNGIDVGHVSELKFDPDNPRQVIVTLQLDPTLRVHDDSVATIASEGLTGGSYVEIDGGSINAPILKPAYWGDKPVIRSKPSTLQELEQSAPQLLAKIDTLADSLNALFDTKNRAALSDTLANLRDTTAGLAKHSTDLDQTLANAAAASKTLNDDLAGAHAVVANTTTATAKLNKLVQDADSTVNGARLDELSAQTRELIRSVTRLSDELEGDPTKLIYGDRRKGYTPP